jgi:hypothetical protein
MWISFGLRISILASGWRKASECARHSIGSATGTGHVQIVQNRERLLQVILQCRKLTDGVGVETDPPCAARIGVD